MNQLSTYSRSVLFFLIVSISSLSVFAQRNGTVRGRLQDTAAHQPVPDATITILQAKDSSLVSFSRTGASGSFLLKGLSPGSYRLQITHVGYRGVVRSFTLTETVKDLDLGEIGLTGKSDQLEEATVMVAPVTIRHDTVEYNAGSFKTKPDAVVEDLLKKLPGMQVDKDGTIKANGQTVKKVLVDGKEFFGNDPKIASKNLPAEAVDKVQVFDKKSDQSQFTGFDDGNSQTTINLTVKKDHKHGVFGKLVAGGGRDAGGKTSVGGGTGGANGGGGDDLNSGANDGRYEGNFNLNQFNNDQQLSAIGMANNTNKQGFSFQDVLGFSGGLTSPNVSKAGAPIQGLTGNSQAITSTRAGGLNFNDDLQGEHSTLHGNYFYNGADDHIDQKDARQYLTPGSSYNQDQRSKAIQHSENQRLTAISDQRIDSFSSVKITSSFTYQNSSRTSQGIDSSYDPSKGALLNDVFSNSLSHARGYNWNTDALLRHKFAKKGRTLSLDLLFGLNSNSAGGNLYSVNRYYTPGAPTVTDTINQLYELPSNGNNYGANLVYTEPLSKKSLLEFHYDLSQANSRSDRKTFDADGAGKYTLPDAALTNDFSNTYTTHKEGVQFRNQRESFNFTVGASLQQALSSNRFHYASEDSSLHRAYLNVLPNANFQYNFNRYQNLRMTYNTFTNQPSIAQLAPVPDNSDPLNIRQGNPDLKQEYYHSIRANYIAFDPFRHTSFFAMFNLNEIQHRIVNDDRVDSVGVRVSRPVNLEGLYNMNGNLGWGIPLRSIRSNLNLNSRVSYDHNASLVNGARNTGNTWTVGQGANLNFVYKEQFDISGGVNVNYNDARYSLQPGQGQVYWTESYTADFNWYGPKGFSVASDLDYTHRSGLPAGYNSSPLVWNAGLAKKLFKNQKGTIRLQVFDLLKQNTGFSRSTNQNYIDDQSYRVLNRYWLVSFTYQLSRFGGKSMKEGMQMGQDIRIIR
ncbi:MAG TPA: outer membrane beta-barrel protein [Puia sp.]|jgi:hypothetical protein